MTTIERITSRLVVTRNVRVAGAKRVHLVTPAEHSGILNRSHAPACGAYIGQPKPRVLTDEPVTCKACLQAVPASASLAGLAGL